MKTYGQLLYKSDIEKWVITELEPHAAIKLKKLFPKIPKHLTKAFPFADTPEVCTDLEWFTQRYPLQISTKDSQRLCQQRTLFRQVQAEMERILQPDYSPKDYHLKPGQALRQYQAQTIEVFLRNKALLCGDEVGLGKSYTGIGACLQAEQLPAIIVVQTHLQKQWQEKITEFSYLRSHMIKGTRPYSLPEADVYIIRYSCLAGWVDLFRLEYFRTVIFDEIQELRRGTASDKGRAAKELASCVQWRLGLTATPIYNYGDEIWNILNILKEDSLGTPEEFFREWGGDGSRYSSTNNGKIIIKDPQALGTYLRENYLFIRRTREDIGQYLSPVNRIVETVGYDELTVKRAEELATQLAIRASQGNYIERGQAARELDLMLRHMTGISKAKYVAEFVRIILESGEPVVLAGWHRSVYDIWQKELADFNPVMYTGSESASQKEKSKQAFLNGDSNLLIISLRSGIGLDGLQHRASIVAIGELDWSPMVHHQLIGRLDREGQTKPVMAIFLCSDSGSDPLLMDLLGLKSSQAQGIIDPHLGIQTIHSDETRIQMMIQKYLKKKGLKVPETIELPATELKQLDLKIS